MHDIFVVIARRAVAAAAHTRSRTRSVTLWRRVLSHHTHTCTHTDRTHADARLGLARPPPSHESQYFTQTNTLVQALGERRASHPHLALLQLLGPWPHAHASCGTSDLDGVPSSGITHAPRGGGDVRPRWRPVVGHHSRPSSAHWPLRSSPPPPPFIRSHSSRLPLQTSQLPSGTPPPLEPILISACAHQPHARASPCLLPLPYRTGAGRPGEVCRRWTGEV